MEGWSDSEEAKQRIPPPMRAIFYDIIDLESEERSLTDIKESIMYNPPPESYAELLQILLFCRKITEFDANIAPPLKVESLKRN